MSQFRLHIDILVGVDETTATDLSTKILKDLASVIDSGLVVQYRLGNDLDRQQSNYFMKNTNGHVGNKKSVLDK